MQPSTVLTLRPHRAIVWAFFFGILSLVCQDGRGQAEDRNMKVNNDREKVTTDGYWIYNDLDKGFAQAKELGKPMLIVLRCIPCEACAQLDEQVVEKNPSVRKHLSNFVCVRLVYTNGMDLQRFQFDYDQSWAVMFMHSDGTILGRYGTRSHQTESDDDISLEGLLDAMANVLALHRTFEKTKATLAGKMGRPAEVAKPELFPTLAGKYESTLNYGPNVARSCIHCHQVGDAIREFYRSKTGTIPTEWIFPYPNPKILGLQFDPKTATTLRQVKSSSPASMAGFKAGDRVSKLNGQPLVSVADIQWILHQIQGTGRLDFEVQRGDKVIALTLELAEGWREQDDISWRVTSWGYRRMVSGGLKLEPMSGEDRKAAGLDETAIGLRVKFVGQFNEHAAAKRAGFKVGDVFVSAGKIEHPLTESQWFAEMLRSSRPGDRVAIKLLRDGEPMTLELPIQP